MAFVLVVTGLLMIVTGARGTYAQFGQQVTSDFTGQGNFTWWIIALGSVGTLGYIEALRELSRLFMALILTVMLLSNRGFFTQLTAALKSGPTAPQPIAGGTENQPRATFGTSNDPTQVKANSYFDAFYNFLTGGNYHSPGTAGATQ